MKLGMRIAHARIPPRSTHRALHTHDVTQFKYLLFGPTL